MVLLSSNRGPGRDHSGEDLKFSQLGSDCGILIQFPDRLVDFHSVVMTSEIDKYKIILISRN